MRKLALRLRVSPAAVKLTYAATLFFNALGSLFPRPGRKRSPVPSRGVPREGSPVNGQGLDPYARIPFGRYDIARSGCAVIAAYNALCVLRDPIPFSRAVSWFERCGSICRGALGVHPLAVRDLLRSRGHDTRVLYAARVKDLSALDDAFRGADAAVLTFWNGPAVRSPGGAWTRAHTVALAHSERGAVVYNARNGTPAPLIYGSIKEYIDSEGVQPVSLLLISG